MIRDLSTAGRRSGLALLVAAGLCLHATSGRAQEDGVWRVFLNGNQVQDVVAVGEDVYAATTGGGVRFSSTGEFTQWNRRPLEILSDSLTVASTDANGDVWFGTEIAGISILDPLEERWSPYTSLLAPIPGDRIRTVRFQEQNGAQLQLVGTEEGYAVFIDGDLRFVCQEGVDICDLPSYSMLDLIQIGDRLWLGTEGGVVIQNADGSWESGQNGLGGQRIVSFTNVGKELYGASAAGVWHWDGGQWAAMSTGLPEDIEPSEIESFDSELWLAGGPSSGIGGVFRWRDTSWERVGPNSFPATSLARTESGRIFAGAADEDEQLDGIWELDGESWKQNKLSGPSWRALYRGLFVDSGERLWFSSAGDGAPLIGSYDGVNWTTQDAGQNGSLRAWTWDFAEIDESLYLAHCCCGITTTDRCRTEQLEVSAGIFTPIDGMREVWQLDVDESGTLWGTSNNATTSLSDGLFRIDPSDGNLQNFNIVNTQIGDEAGLTSNINPTFRVRRRVGWVGSSSEGVDRWRFGPDRVPGTEDDTWDHFNEDSEPAIIGNAIRKMQIADDGKVWIGTTEGLSIWTGSSFTNLGPRVDHIPTAEITAIVTTSNGGAWVASGDAGVTRMVPNESGGFDYTNYRAPLIPNPNVEALALSSDERTLWIGTTRGLASFTPFEETGGSGGEGELGAYPNPFSTGCGQVLRLRGSGGVASGVIVDLAGKVVARFDKVPPGDSIWDGTENGEPVAPGVYVVRVRASIGTKSVAIAVLDGCP